MCLGVSEKENKVFRKAQPITWPNEHLWKELKGRWNLQTFEECMEENHTWAMYASCFSIEEALSSQSTFNLSLTHPPMDTPGATRSSESFPETLQHWDWRRCTDVPTDPTLGTRIRVTHNRTSHGIPIVVMLIRLTKISLHAALTARWCLYCITWTPLSCFLYPCRYLDRTVAPSLGNELLWSKPRNQILVSNIIGHTCILCCIIWALCALTFSGERPACSWPQTSTESGR